MALFARSGTYWELCPLQQYHTRLSDLWGLSCFSDWKQQQQTSRELNLPWIVKWAGAFSGPLTLQLNLVADLGTFDNQNSAWMRTLCVLPVALIIPVWFRWGEKKSLQIAELLALLSAAPESVLDFSQICNGLVWFYFYCSSSTGSPGVRSSAGINEDCSDCSQRSLPGGISRGAAFSFFKRKKWANGTGSKEDTNVCRYRQSK